MSAAPLRDDRIIDWLEEIEQITIPGLPLAALVGVLGVLDAFADEDGVLPRAALQVRARLAAHISSHAHPESSISEQRLRPAGSRHLLSVQDVAASS